MQLSALSRTTSISYSFQPIRLSSINSSLVGDKSKPRLQMVSNSSALYAIPPPLPPKVKLGRTTVGKPLLPTCLAMRLCTSKASVIVCAMPDLADSKPILVIASLNFRRSSALSMASAFAPMSSQLYLANTPYLSKSKAQFKAVCPPIVGNMASGRSLAIIFSTTCHVMGSIYVTSAVSGSVIIVAGLLLTKMTL